MCCGGKVWFELVVGGRGVGNSVFACCSAALMVLAICLYLSWNSSGVSMLMLSRFWSCVIVVIPYKYSLSRYFWVFALSMFGRLLYVGAFFHACSNGVVLMGNARFLVVTCISNSLSSRNSVLAIGDLRQACCLSFGRCSEPPYLADMYLASPWYIIPSWPGSLRACINC